MRELVADARRAADASRDAFLARDAIMLAGPIVATKGAAWLCEQLWQRLAPFVEGDDAPGVALVRRIDSRIRLVYDGATWRRREEWTALHEV